MGIIDVEAWGEWVENNKDPYGAACVTVASRAFELLDEVGEDYDPDDIIAQASRETKPGITEFMAGCVAQMISQCHSRGDEFRRKWNLSCQLQDEGERANESGGILNPALLKFST